MPGILMSRMARSGRSLRASSTASNMRTGRRPPSSSSSDIHTPGDQPDVLVAMNPAALKTNIGDLVAGGALVVNEDAFTPNNLAKVGYAANPLTDGSLSSFTVFAIPISSLNTRSLDGLEMTMSCGVATTAPGETFDYQSLFARADAALYAAKHSGRDCVRLDAPPVRALAA